MDSETGLHRGSLPVVGYEVHRTNGREYRVDVKYDGHIHIVGARWSGEELRELRAQRGIGPIRLLSPTLRNRARRT